MWDLGPNLMTGVLVRGGEETQRQTGEKAK